MKTALGDRLRQHREWIGISIAATAERAGVTAVYLGTIERGGPRAQNPTVKTLRGIARALGLNPTALAALAFEDLGDPG